MNTGVRRAGALLLCGMAMVGLGWGCQATPPAAAEPSAATDSCSERLHDLCGPLLLYQAIHGRLPEKLEDLRAVADPGEDLKFECPASGQAYLYDRKGVAVPGQPGPVFVRDPLPSHNGIRWAIVVLRPEGAQAMNTRVVGLADTATAEKEKAE